MAHLCTLYTVFAFLNVTAIYVPLCIIHNYLYYSCRRTSLLKLVRQKQIQPSSWNRFLGKATLS